MSGKAGPALPAEEDTHPLRPASGLGRWLPWVWLRPEAGRTPLDGARPVPRLSVRLRLALVTSATAVVAGLLALGVTYALLSARLPVSRVVPLGSVANGTGVPDGTVPAPCNAILPRSTAVAGHPLPRASAQYPVNQSAVNACLAALPATAAPANIPYTAIAAAQRSVDRGQFLTLGAVALGLLALLSLGAGWWMAGRMLHPLQVITRRARDLSAEVPLGRIALRGPRDELSDLAETIDGLLGRLDVALAAERRFVANASHELRTPLTIQQTLLDVALADPEADAATLREAASQVRETGARSERVINSLLVLARSQDGVLRRERADLAAAARDAVDAAAVEAERRCVLIDSDLRPARMMGDPDLLERLASNLVENAVRYNVRSGGWASVRTAEEGDKAMLTVANSGPRLDAAEVAHLFEAFRRRAAERTEGSRGAGLGLSIVRAVVHAHGGSVTATARDEGGLEVTVAMPGAARWGAASS